MARLMEIFVTVNAVCGIAAFLIARNMIGRAKRKLGLQDEQQRKELQRGGRT